MLRHYPPLGLDYHRQSKTNSPVMGFQGRYRFLSNFWILDKPFTMHGLQFDCSERAYMWHKSSDPQYRRAIMAADGPRRCKGLGYGAVLPREWDTKIKFGVMYSVLWEKFTQNSQCRDWLLATGNLYLEETNTWNDLIWGRCQGTGENHLGRQLMCVRSALRKL